MYEESIIENVKLIIQQTKFKALSHFVRPALPGEPLIVPGLLVGPDVYWLPVVVGVNPLTDVENIHARLYLRLLPLSSLWYVVTLWTQILMERDDNFRLEELH